MSKCFDCGMCCVLADSIQVSPHDSVPEELVVTGSNGQRWMKTDGRTCAAFDRSTWRCSIYEQRPEECRTFEEGGAVCLRIQEGGV